MREVAGLLICVVLLARPTAPTLATWQDQAVADADPSTAATLLSAPLTCRDTLSTAEITWEPATSPEPLTYTATVGGRVATVAQNSKVTVTPDLLGTLLGTDVEVTITGRLGATEWITKRVRLVRQTVLGLTVRCRPERTDAT